MVVVAIISDALYILLGGFSVGFVVTLVAAFVCHVVDVFDVVLATHVAVRVVVGEVVVVLVIILINLAGLNLFVAAVAVLFIIVVDIIREAFVPFDVGAGDVFLGLPAISLALLSAIQEVECVVFVVDRIDLL